MNSKELLERLKLKLKTKRDSCHDIAMEYYTDFRLSNDMESRKTSYSLYESMTSRSSAYSHVLELISDLEDQK